MVRRRATAGLVKQQKNDRETQRVNEELVIQKGSQSH